MAPTTLPLTDAFFRALAPAVKEQLQPSAALDETLRKVVTAAQERWPQVNLEPLGYVAHLARHLPEPAALSTLHSSDLYLAVACLAQNPAALAAFEREVLPQVTVVLRNLPAGLTPDEVLQQLRLKLLVRRGENPPGLSAYAGRGALVHWLRAAAIRVVQDVARSKHLEITAPDEALLETPAVSQDLDVAYLKNRYAPEFKLAFQEALQQLTGREQNLLRLQYLDGMSPDEIGRIYGTHRTTIWRWLTQCREALLSRTRSLLAARIPGGEAELSSLMNAVHSQLDVSLNRLLRKE